MPLDGVVTILGCHDLFAPTALPESNQFATRFGGEKWDILSRKRMLSHNRVGARTL